MIRSVAASKIPVALKVVLLAAATAAAATALAQSSVAPPPRLITYTGRVENNGVPLNAPVKLRFFLVDVETKTFAQRLGTWSEDHDNVATAGGAFQVLIGTNTPIPPDLLLNPVVFLRVMVGDAGSVTLVELNGAQRLTSAPYALTAGVKFGGTGGNNGTAETVARSDHAHPPPPTPGWVKTGEATLSGTTPVTFSVQSRGTWRVLFNGILFPNGAPARVLIRTSAGGTSGYSGFVIGEGAGTFNTSDTSGLIAARTAGNAETVTAFDYTIAEFPGLYGTVGFGQGTVREGTGTPTLLRSTGSHAGFSFSNAITVVPLNVNSWGGTIQVLELR
jgi:hypothetical protein